MLLKSKNNMERFINMDFVYFFMKRLQRIIGASLFPLALVGCGSCDDYEINYIEGEVVREGGSLVRNLAESSGAFFGNESVKVGKPTYVLTVKTDE